ncbi:hypothetical protein DV515_00014243 [Chloebia gouldiae]|uniref:Uncharacterized protein n=1 Tax=Chloebia gouldiae TaxID=44316 RepID=A0A3L8RYY0_CHLGU|nr:hypothetical protein DV515_00014243 [Chloebia gouldiae]
MRLGRRELFRFSQEVNTERTAYSVDAENCPGSEQDILISSGSSCSASLAKEALMFGVYISKKWLTVNIRFHLHFWKSQILKFCSVALLMWVEV